MAEIHQLFTRRASYGPDRLKVLGNDSMKLGKLLLATLVRRRQR